MSENLRAPASNPAPTILRSIANSIEPAFPSAASELRALAAGWLPPETVTEARARELREADTALRIEEQRAGQRELTDRNAYLRRTVWTRAREIVRARADSLAPEAPSEAMECTCPYTDPSTWLSAASCGYGSGYEPGSMQEWNPDCPVHRPTPSEAAQ